MRIDMSVASSFPTWILAEANIRSGRYPDNRKLKPLHPPPVLLLFSAIGRIYALQTRTGRIFTGIFLAAMLTSSNNDVRILWLTLFIFYSFLTDIFYHVV